MLGALIQLLVAKRYITSDEFDTFVQHVMNGGVDVADKQKEQTQQMPGQQPEGVQPGAGAPGAANQPGAGASSGFGQNNLQR